jgi:hypothetical protein
MMKMAVQSMEMAPGAIPHPGRVSEQRLMSLEIGLRWRQRCRTFLGETPIDLGFSRRRDFIGERAISGGGPGAHTTWWHGQGWLAPPYGAAALWPPSVSPLDSLFVSGK